MDSVRRGVRCVTRWLDSLESLLLYALVAVLLGLAIYQIVLRNVFSGGLYWGDPMLRVLVLWLAMAGAMVATREGGHIRIDVLSHYLGDRGRAWTALAARLFSALICFISAYYSALFVIDERDYGMMAFADVPAWWCEAIIPVGLAVIGLRMLLQGDALAPGGEGSS